LVTCEICSADFVNNNPPPNLHLLLETTIHRVILEPITSSDGKTQYQATSIQGQSKTASGETKSITLKAKKEIILSAGAYNSPFILMHSGVGPKEHLQEHGIDVKLDLKGVGSNLSDHLIVFQFYVLNSNLTWVIRISVSTPKA
jgi:choline dehydrogenase-like flavoprotein